MEAHAGKTMETGEKWVAESQDDGRYVRYVSVSEQRPSESPGFADGTSPELRRRLSAGESIVLEMQSVIRPVVTYEMQKGRMRKAKTGLRPDALRTISVELDDAKFANEGEALVIVLKGVRHMIRNAEAATPVNASQWRSNNAVKSLVLFI